MGGRRGDADIRRGKGDVVEMKGRVTNEKGELAVAATGRVMVSASKTAEPVISQPLTSPPPDHCRSIRTPAIPRAYAAAPAP